MGAGHAHALYVHEHTAVHHLAAEAKLVAAFVFVAAIAVTPREAVWAFGVYAIAVVVLARVARVPGRFMAVRLLSVVPFIVFALFIPFIASGEQIDIWGVSLSRAGLWGTWNVIAKATLGASVSIVLAATTEIPEILRGMSILRVPAPLTAIALFMVRYMELVAGELGRMRIAMTARGYDPRWLWQVRPIAASAGAMFVRSYERGERVHAAMLSRGYSGAMPDLNHRRASGREWLAAGVLPTLGVVVAAIALVVT